MQFGDSRNYRRTTMLELKLALRYARYVLAALATLGFWDWAN
jgi:hypothetical protein